MGVLKNAFLKELYKFNRGDYGDLTLHPEVVMNEVDPPYHVHTGKDDVISYLIDSQTALRPVLNVITKTIIEMPTPPLPVSATHGQVSGADGTYFDNSLSYTDGHGKVV